MNDLPKIGTVVVVDAETIGRVMKTDTDEVVVHCLSFPFFRVIKANNYDVATIKIADSEQKALQQLVLPTLSKDWSLEAWEAEIDDIVEYVLDDLRDEFDDPDPKRKVVKVYLRGRVRYYAKQSEWYTEPEGQEKCVKYSVNYLEVSSDDIVNETPEKERHVWTAIRRASALVHLTKDIYEAVLESLDDDFDDDFDDDDSEMYDSE